MNIRQTLLIAVATVAVVVTAFMIMFGDNGFADLRLLKNQHAHLQERNAQLAWENMQLRRQIDRLKNDPAYIESIARQELGMIGPDEIVIKPRSEDRQN